MMFQYNLPVNLVFGRGRTAEVGSLAKCYGKKVLLVTGASSTKKSGLLDRVTQYLQKEGINVVLFDKVSQNPLTTTAEEGAQIARKEKCQLVLGVGGGSIMDCAKAISFLVRNDGNIHDYIYGRQTSQEALPLILLPTTCGTGSEGNGFAVLTNPENSDKKSLRSSGIISKASIIDPELMETIPKEVLASVGFDALCHCMEAYVSKGGNPITEALAMKGMELIASSLIPLYEHLEEMNREQKDRCWENLSMGSTLGGMAIYTAGVTLPHGMEHPASGLKNIVHGMGLAALTPVIIDISYRQAEEKYQKISEILGGRSAADCADQIRKLEEKLGLACTLSELGILSKDIPWMCENCLKVSAASIENHPILLNRDEIYQLYYRAL